MRCISRVWETTTPPVRHEVMKEHSQYCAIPIGMAAFSRGYALAPAGGPIYNGARNPLARRKSKKAANMRQAPDSHIGRIPSAMLETQPPSSR